VEARGIRNEVVGDNKVSTLTCRQCGRPIEVPAYDETQPFYKNFRRYERAVLKHGWLYHRQDFPPEFKSFSRFMRWITTPEGRAWDKKQRLMIEAEEMIRKGKGWLRNHS